jgi:thioredoxin reductase (NADPH)
MPPLDESLQPTLTDDQIDRLRPYGTEEAVEAGTVLVEEGAQDVDFFLVLKGRADILKRDGREEVRLATSGPGQFTGDIDVLSGQPSQATARMRNDGRILRLSQTCLEAVVGELPDVSDLILRAFLTRRSVMVSGTVPASLQIVGSRFSDATHRIKRFAARNDVPHTWLDVEQDDGAEALLNRFDVAPSETPVVILHGETVLRRPSNDELARAVGTTASSVGGDPVDLVVVGGGPAGLAASVYGASEGLSTLCIEAEAVGGRAGTTSKIENYLGFPTGLSGPELARRAKLQAEKFGARLAIPQRATGLRRAEGLWAVDLSGGERVLGHSVLIATGAQYRKLPLDRLDAYEGAGVYYAATQMEAQLCAGDAVAIVGGGNSAGQAALFLSDPARTVHLLVRSGDLTQSMSRYLVDRIRRTDAVRVHLNTEVERLHGNGHLEQIDVVNNETGATATLPTPALFSFIGAAPCTDWLSDALALDANGFVQTGASLPLGALASQGRDPLFLETSRPGVFAAGDVRSGSVKRVASAVGEGSMAVKFVHRVLAGGT